MSTKDKNVRISKFLSFVLRHDPAAGGITLDEEGWGDVTELLAALARHGHAITRAELDEVVRTNDKKRFAYDDSGRKIRASQGHSVAVDLNLEARTPPEVLYHGTVERFVPGILADGLQKMKRTHVHLSGDVATAIKVGSRRGKPVILEIASGTMHRDGLSFFLSDNGVWLTDHVPSCYVRRHGDG